MKLLPGFFLLNRFSSKSKVPLRSIVLVAQSRITFHAFRTFSSHKVSALNSNSETHSSRIVKPSRKHEVSILAKEFQMKVTKGMLSSHIHNLFVSFVSFLLHPDVLKDKSERVKEAEKNFEMAEEHRKVSIQILHKVHFTQLQELRRKTLLHTLHLLDYFKFPRTQDKAVFLSLVLKKQLEIGQAIREFIDLPMPHKKNKLNTNAEFFKRIQISEESRAVAKKFLEYFENLQNTWRNAPTGSIEISQLFSDFLKQVDIQLDPKVVNDYLEQTKILDRSISRDTEKLQKFLVLADVSSQPQYPPGTPLYPSPSIQHATYFQLALDDSFLCLDNISVTKLKTFMTCSLQYFFRYCIGLKPPRSIRSVEGTALHRVAASVVESTQRNQKISDVELLETAVSEFRKEVEIQTEKVPDIHVEKSSEEERVKYYERTHKIIHEFLQREKKEKHNVISVEKSFSFKFGDIDLPLIIGTFDRLEKDPLGGVVIKEFKTNMSKDILFNIFQLLFYGMAYDHMTGIRATLVLQSLKSGESKTFIPTSKDFDNLKSFIATIVKDIRTGYIHARPSLHCHNCNFRNVCPSAKLIRK